MGEGAKRLRAVSGAGLEEYKFWFAETKNDMGFVALITEHPQDMVRLGL